MPQLLQQRHTKTIQYFTEDLSQQVSLEMAYIPGGTFQMGSPEDELDHFDNESPQHGVTVSEFFMGRFLVTQAQWRVVVAGFPKVDRDLKPNPSKFKSKTEDRPVEQVSWWDAQEFCKRLSKKVGRSYRFPSEAEWEYACRAGTTTPFHFGETISSDVANYNVRLAYGPGKVGQYRQETTAIDSFPPNDFGLCDMHGNVWEWCADGWHKNYVGAPIDGRVWDASNDSGSRIRRGGSWFHDPGNCRSAFRNSYSPVDAGSFIGFRLVCDFPRTSS